MLALALLLLIGASVAEENDALQQLQEIVLKLQVEAQAVDISAKGSPLPEVGLSIVSRNLHKMHII